MYIIMPNLSVAYPGGLWGPRPVAVTKGAQKQKKERERRERNGKKKGGDKKEKR